MTLQSIRISGFRSIRQLYLELDSLNVIVGPNGCGKSNLYKAVQLLHEAAAGRLSSALALEGGVQKLMWAGPGSKGPQRMALSATMDDFDYELQLGFPEPPSGASLFSLDPLVKQEILWLTGYGRRPVGTGAGTQEPNRVSDQC